MASETVWGPQQQVAVAVEEEVVEEPRSLLRSWTRVEAGAATLGRVEEAGEAGWCPRNRAEEAVEGGCS